MMQQPPMMIRGGWEVCTRSEIYAEFASIFQQTNANIPKDIVDLIGNFAAPHIMEFIYTSALDEGGIIYSLATADGSQAWQNPENRELMAVSSSTIMGDSEAANAILGRDAVRCVTKPIENSWFQIEFVRHRVKPKYYMLRHYSSWHTEALRSWKFEGSKNGRTWTVLREHSNDAKLHSKGVAFAWDLPNCDESYSVFRIWQTDVNSNGHHYLSLSGFELWGSLEAIVEPGVKSPKSEISSNPLMQDLEMEMKSSGDESEDEMTRSAAEILDNKAGGKANKDFEDEEYLSLSGFELWRSLEAIVEPGVKSPKSEISSNRPMQDLEMEILENKAGGKANKDVEETSCTTL